MSGELDLVEGIGEGKRGGGQEGEERGHELRECSKKRKAGV